MQRKVKNSGEAESTISTDAQSENENAREKSILTNAHNADPTDGEKSVPTDVKMQIQLMGRILFQLMYILQFQLMDIVQWLMILRLYLLWLTQRNIKERSQLPKEGKVKGSS